MLNIATWLYSVYSLYITEADKKKKNNKDIVIEIIFRKDCKYSNQKKKIIVIVITNNYIIINEFATSQSRRYRDERPLTTAAN